MSPTIRKLSNGLRLVLVPCEAESVAFGVFVASGSRHEPAKVAGISHFIEHMLFKGTPTRRPIDITRAIEGRGGNFNAYTGEETTCYFAHLPDDYLEEAVDILGDMYLNATVPDDEFVREKQVVIEEIKMYADEPDAVAMENLQRALFPKSRLGAPVAGSEKTLAPLKPSDLRDYIKSHYRPDNTVVVLSGHFDEGKALALLERTFGGLAARRAPKSAPDKPLAGHPVAVTKVAKDVQQTQLVLGYRTFGVHDRRRFALTVLDAVLGRGMSSRLFQEVREKRGLSYDISSRVSYFDDAGMLTIAAGLDPAKAELALATIDRELRKVCEKKVSASELKRVKEFLVGNFRLGHERVTSKMFYYSSTVLTRGRIVTPEEQIKSVLAVTPDDVLSVARTIFRPSNRAVSWVVPKSPASQR